MNARRKAKFLAIVLLFVGVDGLAGDLDGHKSGCYQQLKYGLFSCFFSRCDNFEAEKEQFIDQERVVSSSPQEIPTCAPLFSQIKPYLHVPVGHQIAEYEEIYRAYDSGNNREHHMSELYTLLVKRAFPLWKTYVEHNGLEQRRSRSLNLLDTLFKTAGLWHEKNSFTPLLFWRINVLASIIIDWQKNEIKGAIRLQNNAGKDHISPSIDFLLRNISAIGEQDWHILKINHHGKTEEVVELSYEANAVNEVDDSALTFQGLVPIIIYTNCSSALSQDTLLKILGNHYRSIISVFDCELKIIAQRYDKNEKYLPHNGLLSTSCFLYHDLHHAPESTEPFYWADLVKNFYSVYRESSFSTLQHKKMVSDAVFFMAHEIGNLVSYFIDDVKFKNYKFYDAVEQRLYQSNFTLLGNALYLLKEIMPLIAGREIWLVLYEDEALNRVEIVEEFDAHSYKFKMRDWELMLHDGLPKPTKAKQADELKFTYGSRMDTEGNPLLPSLEALLQAAMQQMARGKFSDDIPSLDSKINQWKCVPKHIRLKVKRAALRVAYERFWGSVIQIMLDINPSLIIKYEDMPLVRPDGSENANIRIVSHQPPVSE